MDEATQIAIPERWLAQGPKLFVTNARNGVERALSCSIGSSTSNGEGGPGGN